MSLEDLRKTRLKKLERAKEVFGSVFPSGVLPDFCLEEVISNFSKLSKRRKSLVLVGRVVGLREHGGVIFCDFKEASFSFQAYLRKDILGDKNFSLFEEIVDVGDFLEFKGNLFKTKKGEKSIKISGWKLLAKSLRPLPEKWYGLSDVEERFRKRYLDLLMNGEVYSIFMLRSKIITEIRNFLNRYDFLEVETPVLQPLAGGATAEPFKTHHNALNVDLFLRIAPELYLKRLLVGGIEKVYELGKNFRNEGIDVVHNPEFTMLEFYQAYCDTVFMRGFIENFLKTLIKKVFGKLVVEYEGNKISFSKKFTLITFLDILKRHALINNPQQASIEDFKLKAQQFGIPVADFDSKEKIMDNIFKKVCRPKIIQPTFVIDHPVGLSPLAKRKKDNPELVDRFQLVMGGLELVNGFSELNDPIDQKERFEEQQKLREAGDKEAVEYDRSYVEAMEYGMPPAVGVGVGIDRLVMFLLNIHNIKESILFPTMRSKE